MKKKILVWMSVLLLLLCTGCDEEETVGTGLRSAPIETEAPMSTPTETPTATPTVAPTATPTVAPTATPTVAPTATPTVAPTATPTVAPTATPVPSPEEALTHNKNVLITEIWESRLNAKSRNVSIPIKNFMFSVPNPTSSEIQREIEVAINAVNWEEQGMNEMLPDYEYASDMFNSGGEINLNSFLNLSLNDACLLDVSAYHTFSDALNRKEECYEDAYWYEEIYNNALYVSDCLTDEEYASCQLQIYEFFLNYAKTMTAQPSTATFDSISGNREIGYESIAGEFWDNKLFYKLFQEYEMAKTDAEKETIIGELCTTFNRHSPAMCFWMSNVEPVDADTIRVNFTMFPVYETIKKENGQIIIDKTKYKTIAKMATEVDEQLDKVIETVLEPGMSIFAKEYALFRYCDSFYHYDANEDASVLGWAYADFDNPYTVAAAIDPQTGRKGNASEKSTQGNESIYTVAMTGWGVCVGHARFFQGLCIKSGIRCDNVSGYQHEWNMVRIDGKIYLVDVGKRAVFPHFNITDEWWDTYKQVDPPVYELTMATGYPMNGTAPMALYRAGYTAETTVQVGEWIYYINFDDNGSLYKVRVDGNGDEKVQDSGTTLTEAYESLMKDDDISEELKQSLQQFWETAQYGSMYNGYNYSNAKALNYRYILGWNYKVMKVGDIGMLPPFSPDSGKGTTESGKKGYIDYRVLNKEKRYVVDLFGVNNETSKVGVEAWYETASDQALGIVSGCAYIETPNNDGDQIERIVAVVDGIEYPIEDSLYVTSEMFVKPEEGQDMKCEFTFRLPVDGNIESHSLDIMVTTIYGKTAKTSVFTNDRSKVGIRESYLWRDKYYTITSAVSEDNILLIGIERYTKDGVFDGETTLAYMEYECADSIREEFYTQRISDNVFSIITCDRQPMLFELSEGNQIADILSTSDLPLDFSDIDAEVYISTVEEYLTFARLLAEEGLFQNAMVRICEELDFSAIPAEDFIPVGTQEYPFRGTWDGKYKDMKNIQLDKEGDAGIFAYLEGATIMRVEVHDSSFKGTQKAGIILNAEDCHISNLWIENVSITGAEEAGTVAIAKGSVIKHISLNCINVFGEKMAGGACADALETNVYGVQSEESSIKSSYVAGGIVGNFAGSDCEKPYIRFCSSHASISANDGYAGGIVGYASQISNIMDCKNQGNVSGNGCTGGIVGKCSLATHGIFRVENHGGIYGCGYTGGIAGYIEDIQRMELVSNQSNVTGKMYVEDNFVGGIYGGVSGVLKLRLCYTGYISPSDMGKNGKIGGMLTEDVILYHTLYGTLDGRAISWVNTDNVSEAFGIIEGDVTIVTDDGKCENMWGVQGF